MKTLDFPYPDVLALVCRDGHELPYDAILGANWTLTHSTNADRLRKMVQVGVTLDKYVNGQLYSGIKTGYNPAFIISGLKRAELIAQDSRSALIIKKLTVGDDVRRWRIDANDKWLIYSPWDLEIEDYPAIKQHLFRWQDNLKARPECRDGRYKWWCMARYGAEYTPHFSLPKIVFPDIAKESRFAYDMTGTYINNTTYFIPSGSLYLCGVLNSDTVWEYCKKKSAVLGDAEKGGRLRLIRQYVEKIPIPDAPEAEKQAIALLVQKCLDAKGVDCGAWEAEINGRVAGLYGL